jgi:hypothetical protein
MRFRKLRIAWSVGCLVVSALVVALWMRSQTIHDYLTNPNLGGYSVSLESCMGHQQLLVFQPPPSRGPVATSSGPLLHLRSGSVELGNKIVAWYFNVQKTPIWGLQIATPHWFFVAVGTSLAAAPWIRQFRWRFSLRTLLIATTLVALVLGAIVYLSR